MLVCECKIKKRMLLIGIEWRRGMKCHAYPCAKLCVLNKFIDHSIQRYESCPNFTRTVLLLHKSIIRISKPFFTFIFNATDSIHTATLLYAGKSFTHRKISLTVYFTSKIWLIFEHRTNQLMSNNLPMKWLFA